MDSLRRLPSGAVYTNKSGQATATLTMAGDTIIVYASCDSLQQIVYNLEEELHQARDRLEQKETIKEAPGFTLKCYLTGLITGIILVIIIKITRKWRKQDQWV